MNEMNQLRRGRATDKQEEESRDWVVMWVCVVGLRCLVLSCDSLSGMFPVIVREKTKHTSSGEAVIGSSLQSKFHTRSNAGHAKCYGRPRVVTL